MGNEFRSTRPLYFSIPIVVLIVATGVYGIFFKAAYAQETLSWAVQGVGQDLANLIFAVPSLLVSAALVSKGSRVGLFVWLGTTLYILYTFALYCFALHFNPFFLVYCAVLGLTFYSIISLVLSIDRLVIKNWFDENRSNNFASYFLLAISAFFFLLWIKDIIPAMFSGKPPQSLRENGLMTNPVHVLDLSFFLPGSFIAAILLKKKNSLGYLFAPALIIFCTMMTFSIALLVVVMKVNAVASDVSVAVVLSAVAMIGFLAFVSLMKGIKKKNHDDGSSNL